MRITVLGCGPAGLISAWIGTMKGHEVRVLSDKIEKSYLGGAQYLHSPIPFLSEEQPDTEIMVLKSGTRDGYAAKVYGDPDADVSLDRYGKFVVPGWNLFDAYNQLWEWATNNDMIDTFKVTSSSDIEELALAGDLLVSSVPRSVTCNSEHSFESRKVLVKPELPVEVLSGGRDFIVYDGTAHNPYYRFSRLFGNEMSEYPADADLPDAIEVRKPLKNNCDCWDHRGDIHFIGRYGRWEKSQLVSDAMDQANEVL